ncbi:MAG: hypothetical protein AVDCRST_MAG66-4769, partial [uncultured Pseudonocardia sp.]
ARCGRAAVGAARGGPASDRRQPRRPGQPPRFGRTRSAVV